MNGLEYKIKLRRITESISNSNKILKWLLADKRQRPFYNISRLSHALYSVPISYYIIIDV